jgi:hypothetical protein
VRLGETKEERVDPLMSVFPAGSYLSFINWNSSDSSLSDILRLSRCELDRTAYSTNNNGEKN